MLSDVPEKRARAKRSLWSGDHFTGSGRLLEKLIILAVFLMVSVGTISGSEKMDETPVFSDERVVTGKRFDQNLFSGGSRAAVITRDDIRCLPARDVADLLEMVGGVDVRPRGANGVQTDISIRGSSNEQVLILVDGFSVNDPQTGHHNMDLPVNLDDIDRIEVLKGAGAWIYGHNAMAGVINIITRTPRGFSSGGSAEFGSHEYYKLSGRAEGTIGLLANRLSVSHRTTRGHIEDQPTDSRISGATYKGVHENNAGHFFQLSMGFTDKDFGAYKFYTDIYPDQREKTRSFMTTATDRFSCLSADFEAGLFFRRHEDDFRIRIAQNDLINRHTADSYGVRLTNRIDSGWGASIIGGEMSREALDSSNLGNHGRNRTTLFLDHRIRTGQRVTLNAGGAAIHYSDWGNEYRPGASIHLELTDSTSLVFSADKSFRTPTYTELYYTTPANQGNPDLVPEEARTYEAGVHYRSTGINLLTGFFLRDSENVIDWTRALPQDPWKVGNLTRIQTSGIDATVELFPEILFNRFDDPFVSLSYTYLDSTRDTFGNESKYILDHLRHQFKCFLTVSPLKNLTQSVLLRYEKRLNDDNAFVMDTRFAYEWKHTRLFLDIQNILDESYTRSGFAPDPGRWTIIGVEIFGVGI